MNKTIPTKKLASFCNQLAKRCGDNAWQAFQKNRPATLKLDRTYVTKTDVSIEKYIRNQIRTQFPSHSVVGEEAGGDTTKDYVWYTDPLDGTTNFILGIPIFCSMLCVTHHSQPVASAISVPATKQLFSASAENGASVNGRKIIASSATLADCTLQIEGGVSRASKQRASQFLAQHESQFRSFRRYGSYAGFLMHAATQTPITLCHFQDNQIYEVLAASLWFKEAGYVVLNGSGDDWQVGDTQDIIYTHPNLKTKLSTMLKQTSIT